MNTPKIALVLLSVILLTTQPVAGQKKKKEKITPTRSVVYKTIDKTELHLRIFEPENHKADDNTPVVVFYFGGGWVGGSTDQYYQISERLAKLGLVAIAAEYRIAKKHKTSPFDAVEDAKSAIRYIRQHATELGIDPERIVASGGSAGGHLAACCELIEGLDHPDENLEISSRPNAMILFNPVLDTTKKGYGLEKVGEERKTEISPCHHIRADLAPCLVMHGTRDRAVPFENAERFTRLMQEAGNDCTLHAHEDQGHGFFHGNYFRPKNKNTYFDLTYEQSLDFLHTIEYLPDPEKLPEE